MYFLHLAVMVKEVPFFVGVSVYSQILRRKTIKLKIIPFISFILYVTYKDYRNYLWFITAHGDILPSLKTCFFKVQVAYVNALHAYITLMT